MKKLFTIFVAVLLNASVFLPQRAGAQSPDKMSYQAVIRNSDNALLTSTIVGMQISILMGTADGTAVYVETQTPTTNANGLVSLEIGTGTTTDDFSAISWTDGPYFIKTETDPTGGASYTIAGTSQLLSVPYALHAKTAESITGTIIETDPVYTGSQAVNITATDITNLSNLSGINTGDQDLSTLATKTALGDSTEQVRSEFPDLSNLSGTNTGDQDLSISNDTISLSAGGFVKLPANNTITDADNNTQIQVEESANENKIRFDINGTERWVMDSTRLEPKNTGRSIFIGENVGLKDDLSDNENTFVGYQSGNSNITGSLNTSIGAYAGFSSTGNFNTFVGSNAGYSSTGLRNTFLGYDAGYNAEGSSGNVFIGHKAGYYVNRNNINNRLIIDNENVDSTDVLLYGEFDQNHLRINGNVGINYQAYNSYGLIVDIPDGQTSIYTLLIYGNAWASGGTWSTSDVRLKKNVSTYENALNTIMKFRGVSFDWRVDEYPQQRFSDDKQLGFIAQEVEKVVPDLVKEGPDGFKGVEYAKFTPIIVEAIKEQQKQIEELKAENEVLKQKLNELIDLIQRK
jgi:hypothetical protein